MITLKFPMSRKPTPEEWRKVWGITRIPPNTTALRGMWRIKVGEAQYAELLAYLQALALDSGFAYPLPSESDTWQPWSGGECPEPAPVLVEYRMRCGLTVTRGTPAGDVRWSHAGTGSDVVAYRRK